MIKNNLIKLTANIMKSYCSKRLIMESEKGIFPKELWEKLEENRIIKLALPEKVGGAGYKYKEAMKIVKIVGENAAPIPLAETYIGNWILHENGMRVIEGPLSIVETNYMENIKFESSGSEWVVNGNAKSVPYGRYANNILIIGKNDNQFILSVIHKEYLKINKKNNIAGEARDEVEFLDIKIPKKEGQIINESEVSRLRDLFTLSRISLMAGSLSSILELTIEYANNRKQFGRPIGKFQAIKQQIALAAGQVAASNIVADYAIDRLDRGLEITEEVSMAKVQIGEAANITASIAHQVHGAVGMTKDHPLNFHSRRIWSWRDEGGSESYWANYIGNHVLHDINGSLWNFITAK